MEVPQSSTLFQCSLEQLVAKTVLTGFGQMLCDLNTSGLMLETKKVVQGQPQPSPMQLLTQLPPTLLPHVGWEREIKREMQSPKGESERAEQ